MVQEISVSWVPEFVKTASFCKRYGKLIVLQIYGYLTAPITAGTGYMIGIIDANHKPGYETPTFIVNMFDNNGLSCAVEVLPTTGAIIIRPSVTTLTNQWFNGQGSYFIM